MSASVSSATILAPLDHAHPTTALDGASVDATQVGSTGNALGRQPAVHLGPLEVRPHVAGPPQLPTAIARWVQDADADIARGRYESALDLTLLAEALAPDYLPLFVRHAELLLTTDRPRDAVYMAELVSRLLEARGEDGHPFELLRIVAHAEPSAARLVDLARGALQIGQPRMIERYVPDALGLLVAQGAFNDARDLAAHWQSRVPHQPEAVFAHVRELLRAGDAVAAVAAATPAREQPLPLVAALAAQVAAGSADQWAITARLVRLERGGHGSTGEVDQHLTEFAPLLDRGALSVHRAVLLLSNGKPREALDVLHDADASSPVSDYVAGVCAARAAALVSDGAGSLSGLRRAFTRLENAQVTEFAGKCALFDPPADRLTVGQELAATLLQADEFAAAVEVFQHLMAIAPNNAAIARSYAEALGRSGARDEAIGRLAELLRQQEQARQRTAALETMQTMVRIAPGNIGYRTRLVESYLQSGRVSDAVGELYILAQLQERQGRVNDAAAQLQRAAEIAVLTSEWSKVDRIYRYLIRLLPDDLGARHAAAATYLQHGQIEQALEHLREVARISLLRDDPDEAVAALHQIIALAPDDPEPYHRLGEVLSSIGEYGQAERVYRRLAALLPDDPAVKAKQTALAALAQGHA